MCELTWRWRRAGHSSLTRSTTLLAYCGVPPVVSVVPPVVPVPAPLEPFGIVEFEPSLPIDPMGDVDGFVPLVFVCPWCLDDLCIDWPVPGVVA